MAADPLVPLISQAEIATAIARLAQQIDADYQQKSPVVIGVLKGSFIFLADLVRAMQTPIQRIELLRFSSYGTAMVSSGQATLLMGLTTEVLTGQDVILVEDIVDTGLTTTAALHYLKPFAPASVKLCSLLDKPNRRQVPVTIDYLGFTVPDRFIVGYGIDHAEQYRQLPAIYTL